MKFQSLCRSVCTWGRSVCWILALAVCCVVLASAQDDPAWSGNLTVNPGFEEDFVNVNGESHVLSFKGDWYYNQQDLVPDYWALKGGWTWADTAPHGGRHTLKLAAGATASQSFVRASSQSGGGNWGGVNNDAIPISAQEAPKFAQPWRASVWVRGGGRITLCGVSAEAKASSDWQLLTVECPANKIPPPAAGVGVVLTGPGEFDDVVVQEKLPTTPNLAPNASFEEVDKAGYPVGWGQQKKFRAIGPTYYVWTDWNHCFRENRGPVVVDPLVAHSGKQSLRFDVYPGDEKYVESDLITLNQDQPHVIEVGVHVRADRIRLIDVRCVDEDGLYMPGCRPSQPENHEGGSCLYGNGTFGWRYVHKFFATPNGRPVKGIHVRLCARGFNGHTLDNAGTKPYCMQVGTVWWDDVYVMERTTDAAALSARKVRVPGSAIVRNGLLVDGIIDPGERMFGENVFTYDFINKDATGSYQLRLKTKVPGQQPVETTSPAVTIPSGKRGTLAAPYKISTLAANLLEQGSFQVELLRGGKPVASSLYAFNTWPVIANIDVSRHYNLPAENPVTVSVNFGVADKTLAAVKKVEMELYRPSDKKSLGKQEFPNLAQAFAQTIQTLPKGGSYEFSLPTPAWWVDRTKLLITKVDLSPLKVWPHNEPTRDTVLIVRGLDASGKELFSQQSDPFCRMQQRPAQEAIKAVEVRDDGAILINGKPRYLTGASHQNNRIYHGPEIIAQLGLMGHRLPHGFQYAQFKELWDKYNLYALEMKPVAGQAAVAVVDDMTPEQRKAFEDFVNAGGMQNIVSINTGGWEMTIDTTNQAVVAKHKAMNDWIRQVSKRPVAVSSSGAYNAWWLPELTFYDIDFGETEMWGPMDFNVIYVPYMKAAGAKPAWMYLPQLYDNTPYERFRFETYENIIRGSSGFSMIQGIGDPTFNRGLAGELRCLEEPMNSLEKAPVVTFDPDISHKVTQYKGKTYVLATNCGPIGIGRWTWNREIKNSGQASHEGDSVNTLWFRPGGIRIHGFRGMPMPELIQKGDKIVQYVWIDPKETPDWVMVAVRGNGRFAHNAVLGNFKFDEFCKDWGNVLMFSELNHSVWHEINWVMDDATYQRAVKVMGKEADQIRKGAEAGKAVIDKTTYQAENFHNLGSLPKAESGTG